jgi:hypothetical protein
MSETNTIENRVIDLTNDAATNRVSVPDFSRILTTERLVPACSFCECPGHNVRTCRHPDREKLHECAEFIYLTTCHYLQSHPNTERTHKMWLDNLSMSEYKILAKLNRLDTDSKTTREQYQEKLDAHYIEYAEDELRNVTSTNATTILNLYIDILLRGLVTDIDAMIYAVTKLTIIIKNSGRHLMDMPRFRYWLGNHMDSYYGFRQFRENRKQKPTMTHDPSLPTEVHDECPICYTEMTNESMVQLGCAHSFCGNCIIGQIKSSRKPTSECGLCRATISECRSSSKKLLQKISSSII